LKVFSPTSFSFLSKRKMNCRWILLLLSLSILLLWWALTRVRESLKPLPLFTSIYYINLDKRPEKREKLELQLRPLEKLTGNIIRFRAIDGEILSGIDSQIVDVQGAEDLKSPDKTFGLSLTKGAIGCALSHKTIWEEVVKTKKDLVLILEDDAVILPTFVPILLKLYGNSQRSGTSYI